MAFGIYGLLLAIMLVMRFFPNSSAGLMLNRQLVEVPLQVLGGMRRHHLIFLLLLAGLMLGGAEVIASLGTMDFAVIWALDVSLYVDGLLVALTLASVARSRAGLTAFKAGAWAAGARLRRAFGRRRVRSIATRKRPASANDDDHPAVVLAA